MPPGRGRLCSSCAVISARRLPRERVTSAGHLQARLRRLPLLFLGLPPTHVECASGERRQRGEERKEAVRHSEIFRCHWWLGEILLTSH